MPPIVDRRRFDHLVEELSLALGALAPRYRLWLRLRELEADPDALTATAAIQFCQSHLAGFLREEGLELSRFALMRVRRRVARYDPAVPTPYERMEQLGRPS